MLARAGIGILLQPNELVRDDLHADRLIEILPDFSVPVRPFHLGYALDRRMTPKRRSFIEFALETIGEPEADSDLGTSPLVKILGISKFMRKLPSIRFVRVRCPKFLR